MGDIADMMIDGTLDANTGEYIDGDSPGYPRTLDGSLPWERNRSNNPTFGIKNYLGNNGITGNDQRLAIQSFFPQENVNNISNEVLCTRISKDFGNFKKHVANIVKTSKPFSRDR